MDVKEKFWATRPFSYGSDNKELDRGQVFHLEGMANDQALVRMGYCARLPKDTVLKQCVKCGEHFVDEAARAAHYKGRHGSDPAEPPLRKEEEVNGN